MDPPSHLGFKRSVVGGSGSCLEVQGRLQRQRVISLAPTPRLTRSLYQSMTPKAVSASRTNTGDRQDAGSGAQSPKPPPRTLRAPIFPDSDAFKERKPSIYLLPRTQRSRVPFLPDSLDSQDEEQELGRLRCLLGPPRLAPRSPLPFELGGFSPIS
jgi:hypothetical protein